MPTADNSTAETPTQHLEDRWLIARRLWDARVPVAFIASLYHVTEPAMGTRIQKYRKLYGWFPPRPTCEPRLVGTAVHVDPLIPEAVVALRQYVGILWNHYGQARTVVAEELPGTKRFTLTGCRPQNIDEGDSATGEVRVRFSFQRCSEALKAPNHSIRINR